MIDIYEYDGIQIRYVKGIDIYAVKGLILYQKSIARQTELIEPYGISEFLITLNDGRKLIFDRDDNSIHKLFDRNSDISDEDFKKEFARRLRRRLWHTSMNQEELAERIEISQAQISKYLNGKALPSFLIMDKLARILKCKIDDFMY